MTKGNSVCAGRSKPRRLRAAHAGEGGGEDFGGGGQCPRAAVRSRHRLVDEEGRAGIAAAS